MPSISKSRLKAHMLRIFREIEETGEEWVMDTPATLRKRPASSPLKA